MSQNTNIEVCPVCGHNTLKVTVNPETKERKCVCAECKFEHTTSKMPENMTYVQNLCYLKFFGNTYEHVVEANDVHTLADAEKKAQEIEQINGIQSIKIIVMDEEMQCPMVVSGVMSEH